MWCFAVGAHAFAQMTAKMLVLLQVLAIAVLLIDKPPRWSSTDVVMLIQPSAVCACAKLINTMRPTMQVLANAVLLIDKPPRWSSTDVVRELKRTLRAQKVCHGGPLDAHATGLLIILMGEEEGEGFRLWVGELKGSGFELWVRELKRTLLLQQVCHGGSLDAHSTGLPVILMGEENCASGFQFG
jgi:tRNA U55 pseudouridine synthase TruB